MVLVISGTMKGETHFCGVEERGKNTELRELRLDLVCATNRDSA
jgi:hypothetical protein